ncbi:MAG: lipoprotein-releasing ABC transporter permease subunit [Pseudomonadota bacterium]|nr:lipoprotein-releasing ABC transporter permease subunit [Pseudomonadota bacterium]
MFGTFERMIAVRYLRSKRKEGFVSVIAGFSLVGIGLGVATLIIVMSVMNGYRQDIMERILGVDGHIDIVNYGDNISDYKAKEDIISNIPGVVSVMPQVTAQVMVSVDNFSSGSIVRGVEAKSLLERPIVSNNIIMGSIKNFDNQKGVIIGTRMASRASISVGDNITLISPNGNITAFGEIPRIKQFEVAAIFDVGMSDFNSSIIFMPLDSAQVFFKINNQVSEIEVQVENPDNARLIAREIFDALDQKINVYSWESSNVAFFNALQVERNVMFLILTLIIIVAAFNIISGLIMLVKDKSKDIAILRTMGATRMMIMKIFFLSGASIGFIGTVFGLLLGILFCENIEMIRSLLEIITGTNLFSPEIYFLSTIPAEINWVEVSMIVLMSLVLSLSATIYPSWRASLTDPVETLRYD